MMICEGAGVEGAPESPIRHHFQAGALQASVTLPEVPQEAMNKLPKFSLA